MSSKSHEKYPPEIRIDKLYKAWYAMIDRCMNDKNKWFHRYGGRGIRVCAEWMNYVSFAEWALHNGFGCGLSLDRIDNNGNYEPKNCRWVSIKKQQNNRCSNRYFTIDGETKSLSEWCEHYHIRYSTVLQRLNTCEDIETALTKTHKYRGYGIPIRCIDTGETFASSKIAAEKYGVSLGAIARAARNGSKSGGMRWEQIYDEIPERIGRG